jgi:hypothetical protein
MDIQVFDKSLNLITLLENIESLIWIDRFQGFGEFEIYTAIKPAHLLYLVEDNYIKVSFSDRTMIIESVEIKTDVELGNKLIVKGRSLETLLERRFVINQTRIASDVQNAILTLVNRSCIQPEVDGGYQDPTDPYKRKIPNMQWANNPDTTLASKLVTYQAYSEYVYDLVFYFAQQTGVGFKITMNTAKQFICNVYLGTDRSYTQTAHPYVVFSSNYENLLSSNYFRTNANLKNFIYGLSYVYDTGALHVRSVTKTGWDDPTGINHRERFVDIQYSLDRFVQGTTEFIPTDEYNLQVDYLLDQLSIIENSIVEDFEGKADTTVGFVYGVDFFLGDIVQIENEYGLKGRSMITEVLFTESPTGFFVHPTFSKV